MRENFDKKIVVRLAGGLGNQIFQLGAGLLYAQKLSISKLVIDDAALDSYKVKRTNNLIQLFDFSKSSISIYFGENPFTKFRFARLLPLKVSYWPLISDKNFQTILQSKKRQSRYLDGYFQRCLRQEDFDNIAKLLSQVFILPILDDDPNKCVIHIRGSDFLTSSFASVTPVEYYQSAIKYMSEKYCVEEFLVVTDDLDYAKHVMNTLNMGYLYKLITGNIISDFQIIASTKKRIISNSTFSLWASALGNNDGSAVIAPKLFKPNSIRPFCLMGETEFSF